MAILRASLLTAFLVLSACSSTQWQIDDLATNNPVYDSSRIRYTSDSPMQFEMLRVGNEIEAFLSLTHARFKSEGTARVLFTATSGAFEDLSPVHEGKMRIRLSHGATERLIKALRKGEIVSISLDGFTETLYPGSFTASFNRFLGEKDFYETLLKGVL